MTEVNDSLPDGWAIAELQDICRVIYRYPTFYGMDHLPNGIPVIRGEHLLKDGTISHDWNDYWFVSQEISQQFPKTIVELGDLVLSVRGSVGKIAYVDELLIGAQVSPNCLRISLYGDGCLPRYLMYFWQSSAGQAAIQSNTNATTIQTIKAGLLGTLKIPIPPIDEQRRIVAAIESLFTQLDAGIAALKRLRTHLKRYKATVLKAACEGRLVPQDSSDEPASDLLARILAERHAKWEADLIAKGKDPRKAKYEEPTTPDTSDLPELPPGWVWATWDQLSPRVTVGYVGKMADQYIETGIPFLRSQNVRENRFESEGLLFISNAFHDQLKKSALAPGDLVVVRSGSVGVTCVIPPELEEANCADLVVIKRPNYLQPLYGAYYMNSLAKRKISQGKVGIALVHFNTESVAKLPVPFPPTSAQVRIIEKVERYFSMIEKLEAVISNEIRRSERLRQTILKHAFSGKLVPQDPSEESASELLDRIHTKHVEPSSKPRKKVNHDQQRLF